jgi:hypothetical protein
MDNWSENQDIHRTLSYLLADVDIRLADGVIYHELHGDQNYLHRALAMPASAKYITDELSAKIGCVEFIRERITSWDGHRSSKDYRIRVKSPIHKNQIWLKPKTYKEPRIGDYVQQRGALLDTDPHKLYRVVGIADSKLYLSVKLDHNGFHFANMIELMGAYDFAVANDGSYVVY